jgi:aspartate 1-decarboxylase
VRRTLMRSKLHRATVTNGARLETYVIEGVLSDD